MTNINIRTAKTEDLKTYNQLLQDFHKASPMDGVISFDPAGCLQFLQTSVNNQDVLLLVAEIENEIVGVTAAVLYPMYFNPQALVAQELWWWLTPKARGSGAGNLMFKTLEQWSKEKKASVLFMIALEDERAASMEKVYGRAGFKPMERTFSKELN
jgi:N-acetylglutamate synthase-like GNAT family acetyltransferase